jgi:hypothetical protein
MIDRYECALVALLRPRLRIASSGSWMQPFTRITLYLPTHEDTSMNPATLFIKLILLLARGYMRGYEWIIHKVIYKGRLTGGTVDFYAMSEETALPFDGYLVVMDQHLNKPQIYAYRFSDRYLVHASASKRCAVLWQNIMLHDQLRPLAMLENNRAYTPYGNYAKVPKAYADMLKPAIAA